MSESTGNASVEVAEPLRHNIGRNEGSTNVDSNDRAQADTGINAGVHIEPQGDVAHGETCTLTQNEQNQNICVRELLNKYGPPVGMIVGGGKSGGNVSSPPKRLRERCER